ncbi:ATP-binding cassette domain-containing protein [Crassaminicella thermophila]|uniref:ATP-binding cassette domain-containing protein n=1 Tax=Crassaminicella thermophila TaxID=2599308 RepID=A0A5C0SJC8_CRATE|nr:ATP-binding cassette domain-containing protein [Crassaminicella thermophila]QEK13059.1 ATP-binding cassette domain-containing protein [Crassaminicella thermophila]
MLNIEHIYKTLGEFQLKDINFKIKKGEYFVILGPTGTGKSVILETIAGMYKPDKGKIYFDGKEINNLYPEDREVGFVYQDYLLFPHLSVRENIVFGLKRKKFSKKEIKKKLYNIASNFQIEHLLDRKPKTLSGGEQQRVAIARALITSPKILLFDEPLSALDPSTKKKFIDILKEIHKKTESIIIHVTHDFYEALELADKIAVMNKGNMVQIGTPDEIFYKSNSSFVKNFIGVVPFEKRINYVV